MQNTKGFQAHSLTSHKKREGLYHASCWLHLQCSCSDCGSAKLTPLKPSTDVLCINQVRKFFGGGQGLDLVECFDFEMSCLWCGWKAKCREMRWPWEVVVWCLSRAGAAHSFAQGAVFIGTFIGTFTGANAAFPSQSHPSSPSPCLSLHSDLGAPQGAGNAQQVLSQAEWWCPKIQAEQNLASSPDLFLHVKPGKQRGFHWDLHLPFL